MKAESTVPRWQFFRAGIDDAGVQTYARRTDEGVEYPWLRLRKAQSYAKQNGARAVLHQNEAAALAAYATTKR